MFDEFLLCVCEMSKVGLFCRRAPSMASLDLAQRARATISCRSETRSNFTSSLAAISSAGNLERSLLVIGAHGFGGDPNDPLFAAAQQVRWTGVTLLEANPSVARQLQHSSQNLQARGGVRVLNEGVCPVDTKAPFFHLDILPNETRGLPPWATQISSFNRSQVEKHLPLIRHAAFGLRGGEPFRPVGALEGRIRGPMVRCRTLDSLLRHHSNLRKSTSPLVLMIDIEGLDCQVVGPDLACVGHGSLLLLRFCSPTSSI